MTPTPASKHNKPPSMQHGQYYRIHPETPDDEIIISGLSGMFPKSNNVREFEYNLYNKIDMGSPADPSLLVLFPDLPIRWGQINAHKFDATFFGVHFMQAQSFDPQARLIIERAYEAVLDAGINPQTIRNTKTGVFVGVCLSEADKTYVLDDVFERGFGISGCSRNMLANRVSYTMGFTGPSFAIDTACSSSMYALDAAFTQMRNGLCDSAIVGGVNLCLFPQTTLEFMNLGILSKDGITKSFDENANGYMRAESVCAIYLQKIKNAKRIYAKVIYSKTNCDGHKEEGITFPSMLRQQELLTEFYQEIQIDPSTLNYVEAHATGTTVGDPVECEAIDSVFCKNRTKPLLIGSVKSNIGHSEGAAGVNAIAKVLLAFENGAVAPNLHIKNPHPLVPAIKSGRFKLCTEVTKLDGPLISINSFGFGGANAHALFHGHTKEKINFGLPRDDLPRLVIWAGRTQAAVEEILNDIETRPLDTEFIALLYNIQSVPIHGFVYRGYGVYQRNADKPCIRIDRKIQHHSDMYRPIVWVFSGMGSQWNTMGKEILKIPIINESLTKSHNVLKPFGLNLMDILTSDNKEIFENILHSFVGIAAIQIALVDILKYLNVPSDYFIGHSVGELGCAYADGCFTAEQMLLAAYSRGMASLETKLSRGLMAAVAMGYKKIKEIIPDSIEVACHNSMDSSTISGPESDIIAFVAQLKAKGMFASVVRTSNIAYHSRYISSMGPNLLKRLREIIPEAKKRSPKWLSSSVPQTEWSIEKNQYSSAEYHTNNLLSSVLFEETAVLLPENAIAIEVAPTGLLQAILKKSMPKAIHIGLTDRKSDNNLHYILGAFGNIFMNGITIQIDKIYPPTEFPVSRTTPTISSLIKWDHSADWYVFGIDKDKRKSCQREIEINMVRADSDTEYFLGHIIDGRCLIPATAYLEFTWQTFELISNIYKPTRNVEFSDVKFLRATSIQKDQIVRLTATIQFGSGLFELTENTTTIATGRICEIDYEEFKKAPEVTTKSPTLQMDDFYKELRLRGYHYNGLFKSVQEARCDGLRGKIKWVNWVTFTDCLLQISLIANDSRSLYLPTGIRRIRIYPKVHLDLVESLKDDKILNVSVCKETNTITSGGIEISGCEANAVNRRHAPGVSVHTYYKFVPHIPTPEMTVLNACTICVQLAFENIIGSQKMKCIEIDDGNNGPIINHFEDAIDSLPLVSIECSYLTAKEGANDLGKNINKVNEKISEYNNCTFIITQNSNWPTECGNRLMDKGFIIARVSGSSNYRNLSIPNGFNLIAFIPLADNNENLILFQKYGKPMDSPLTVKVKSDDLEYLWLTDLQVACKSNKTVIVVAEHDSHSGIIGLINCLRKEPDGNRIVCVFIDDNKAPEFDVDNLFYKNQLNLGMAINVYRDSKWGSYRHLRLSNDSHEFSYDKHFYATTLRRGDLGSFAWFQGAIDIKNATNIVAIHYSSINFRDVMLATARLSEDVYGYQRNKKDCVLGLEYSGINRNGDRVMGMVEAGAMATYVTPLKDITWVIPDDWSLKEAATVPVVYITVYLGLFIKCTIQNGKSILIHAGSGGIGLAAIRVALAYGLEVYTTVSTKEKKQYLLKEYPELKESNIGNSRDCSFEHLIMTRTQGKGVDYVLNSLSEDKLQASIRCLGAGGVFLEIGRFDLSIDTKIGLGHFLKEITFASLFADNLLKGSTEQMQFIRKLIDRDIKCGIIKPLPSTVFEIHDIESAYRFMSTGKHIGKVMLRVRKDTDTMRCKPTESIRIHPRVYCDPNLVYILVGGLGGFGMELADWLMLRGARKFVLSSSRGISNGYQESRIINWKTYGCTVHISTADIKTHQGCKQLLVESIRHGAIGGIFNLAVCLKDSILENQTKEMFYDSLAPKAYATKFLDELSRTLCPRLRHFVVFSSVSCGMGNAGQCNYGMANSIMERIVEERQFCNLPAKAIQWGAIGEVGILASVTENNIDKSIGGTLPQRISSCINDLDALLCNSESIVCSMVIAQKISISKDDVVNYVLGVMGIQDIKSISLSTPLSKFGLDSLMTVELRQTLERDYEIYLTINELRAVTFGGLQEMSSKSKTEQLQHKSTAVPMTLQENPQITPFMTNIGDESESKVELFKLDTLANENHQEKTCILILPGIEGVAGHIWPYVGKHLKLPTYVLQYLNAKDDSSLNAIVQSMKIIVLNLFKNMKRFYLVGYSYGSIMALQYARILEDIGMKGKIILIDGSPLYVKLMAKNVFTLEDEHNNPVTKSSQIKLLPVFIQNMLPNKSYEDIDTIMKQCKTTEDKIVKLVETVDTKSRPYITKCLQGLIYRMKLVVDLDENAIDKIHTPITLIKPNVQLIQNVVDDYRLSNNTDGIVNISIINGTHSTMLENRKLVEIINEHFL